MRPVTEGMQCGESRHWHDRRDSEEAVALAMEVIKRARQRVLDTLDRRVNTLTCSQSTTTIGVALPPSPDGHALTLLHRPSSLGRCYTLDVHGLVQLFLQTGNAPPGGTGSVGSTAAA